MGEASRFRERMREHEAGYPLATPQSLLPPQPRSVSFTAFGEAAPQGSKVKTRYGGMRDDSKKLMPWRSSVANAAGQAMAHKWESLFEGPVQARLLFVFPRAKSHFKASGGLTSRAPAYPRLDVDKLARAVLDAITGVVVLDDSQVTVLEARKEFGTPARCEVTIVELIGGDTDEPAA